MISISFVQVKLELKPNGAWVIDIIIVKVRFSLERWYWDPNLLPTVSGFLLFFQTVFQHLGSHNRSCFGWNSMRKSWDDKEVLTSVNEISSFSSEYDLDCLVKFTIWFFIANSYGSSFVFVLEEINCERLVSFGDKILNSELCLSNIIRIFNRYKLYYELSSNKSFN